LASLICLARPAWDDIHLQVATSCHFVKGQRLDWGLDDWRRRDDLITFATLVDIAPTGQWLKGLPW